MKSGQLIFSAVGGTPFQTISSSQAERFQHGSECRGRGSCQEQASLKVRIFLVVLIVHLVVILQAGYSTFPVYLISYLPTIFSIHKSFQDQNISVCFSSKKFQKDGYSPVLEVFKPQKSIQQFYTSIASLFSATFLTISYSKQNL